MAVLAVQDADGGLAAVNFQAAAAGGDQIPQGSAVGGWALPVVLIVNNTDAASKDVTVANVDGSAGTPVTVPASSVAVIPVHGIYNGALRDITYSGVTGVQVAAVGFEG